MRWRFADKNNPEEVLHQKKVIGLIEAWWQEFEKKADALSAFFSNKQQDWDLPGWMQDNLHAIHPGLMWEFGRAIHTKGHRLVITPECQHHLRPLLGSILKRAPKIAGWEFYPYRLAEDIEKARAAVEARTGVDISDYKVQITANELNQIDLSYFSPSIKSESDQNAGAAAVVATESLLGEECLDKWVAVIEAFPLKKTGGLRALLGKEKTTKPGKLLPLNNLQRTVKAVISSIQDQLPREPYYKWIDDAKWSAVSLQPVEADDYPGQTDLIAGVFAAPTIWTASFQKTLFYSKRFSRHKEIFCYIKMDGTEGLDDEHFSDREDIENALNGGLIPNKLGCVIGGGTGLRYSYIDLALADFVPAINAIRKILRAGKIPKRSWIQFHDSELAAEWIGFYRDCPIPPMPTFDD